jgi:glutamine amidotransferase
MQILFERGNEFADGEHLACGEPEGTAGCGEWPGTVERLHADVLPHMGWNTVAAPRGSVLFAGMGAQERFYFVHSYGVRNWELHAEPPLPQPLVTWAHHGEDFVAAAENGPLSATQFHPEKSGDAGAAVLSNWLGAL